MVRLTLGSVRVLTSDLCPRSRGSFILHNLSHGG